MGMEEEKEQQQILTRLALLEKMMRLHVWTAFGQQEAEALTGEDDKPNLKPEND